MGVTGGRTGLFIEELSKMDCYMERVSGFQRTTTTTKDNTGKTKNMGSEPTGGATGPFFQANSSTTSTALLSGAP